MAENLPVDFVRAFLNYDASTGVFTRRVGSGGVKVGEQVGCVGKLGYTVIGILGRTYKAHRLAWLHFYGEWPNGHLDHINGIPSDNRIVNLRCATRSQNKANSKLYKNSTSGVKGVRFYQPLGKWLARVGHQGKRHHIGYFDTKEDATIAYRNAARELHGEFARDG